MTAVAKKVGPLPAPTSVQGAIDRVLAVASSQVGYHEGRTSSGGWNNDTVFGLWYGLNFNAWCAMFVSWCANVAGSDYPSIIPRHAYTPSGFNWFSSRGLADGRKPPNRRGVSASGTGKPRVGDVMYVYNTSLGRISHVGFVEKVLSGGRVQTLEGNTNTSGSASGDGVYRLIRQVSSRLYFCHPQYAAVVTRAPAKPGVTPVAPPKEEDPMAGITKQDMTDAMTAALKAVVPPTEALYVTADNRHDAQAWAYLVGAQAHANVRYPQLLADGKSAREAMDQIRSEVWPFLSALWADAPKKAATKS